MIIIQFRFKQYGKLGTHYEIMIGHGYLTHGQLDLISCCFLETRKGEVIFGRFLWGFPYRQKLIIKELWKKAKTKYLILKDKVTS